LGKFTWWCDANKSAARQIYARLRHWSAAVEDQGQQMHPGRAESSGGRRQKS